jgi:hypothetical protein
MVWPPTFIFSLSGLITGKLLATHRAKDGDESPEGGMTAVPPGSQTQNC